MQVLDKTLLIENLHSDDEFSSDEFNDIVIKKVSIHPGWYISNDESKEKIDVPVEYSDSGMLIESFYDSRYQRNWSSSEYKSNKNEYDEINFMANLVFQKILNSLPFQFKEISLVRYLWNYYNRSSTGVPHNDISENIPGNFCSIVYHLNTCDGATIVGEDEFLSKSGQCIIFDSKKTHRGTGPKESPRRYCLNIVFRYESIEGFEE